MRQSLGSLFLLRLPDLYIWRFHRDPAVADERPPMRSSRVKRRTWQILCASEWPTFGVGWPPGGYFYSPLIQKVRDIVFQPGLHSHPDQQPYILTWQDLCESPPPWAKPFLIPAPAPIPSPTILSLKPSAPPPPPPSVLPESLDLTLLDSPPPPYLLPLSPNPQHPLSDSPAADSASPPLEEAEPAQCPLDDFPMAHTAPPPPGGSWPG
ncbi:leucine-rich repeat extensin-like protein 3 [Marmota marmota marmota]|uniref:leucine-rich repeat extensin-like protein 3 n=1 Tax=Marmota marmota marmota TaxID=9994 RepID=UPI00209362FE|nr:leucine-rich repeat extensin-like protein 3 [Marmota marmota marmota]